MTRIIAGEARGRTIKVPAEGPGLLQTAPAKGCFHPSLHGGALLDLQCSTFLPALVP